MFPMYPLYLSVLVGNRPHQAWHLRPVAHRVWTSWGHARRLPTVTEGVYNGTSMPSPQPRGGYGTATPRLCYSCSRKRLCYLFDCHTKTIHRVTGLAASPLKRVPLCQECAGELFTVGVIDNEIAVGRLSRWHVSCPPEPTEQPQLSLLEEQ